MRNETQDNFREFRIVLVLNKYFYAWCMEKPGCVVESLSVVFRLGLVLNHKHISNFQNEKQLVSIWIENK